MKTNLSIITVGFCPSWDTLYSGEGLDWGRHSLVSSTASVPAGKAMNVSRCLAWMGAKSMAAGLWGRADYAQMREAMRELPRLVNVKMTAVEGATRRNVTVVDTARKREMHLRCRCNLASKKALRQLRSDLGKIVTKKSVCVFAGLMPESKYLSDILGTIRDCRERGARVAIDTYGAALRRIVDAGLAWLIKPNIEELRELLGEDIPDRPASLAKAARMLLDRVEIVLVSRGPRGAVVVTKDGAWHGRCLDRREVLSTVGCGDYLLGGFLKGLQDTSDAGLALRTAVKVATAKAWALCNAASFQRAASRFQVTVANL